MSKLQKAWQKSFSQQNYRLGLHALFWIFYISLISFISPARSQGENNVMGWRLYVDLLYGFLANLFIIAPSYYLFINTTYRFFVGGKRLLWGLLCLVGCFFIYSHLFYFSIRGAEYLNKILDIHETVTGNGIGKRIREAGYWGFFGSLIVWVQMIFSFILLMSMPVVAHAFRDHLRLQWVKNSLEKQNLKLKMDFLKAQIHPHFLFNTLNNIYSLITNRELERSAEMVSGLSSLLRYTLYDGKAEFSSLEKEINMLKDFIELQAVRSDNIQMEIRWPDWVPAINIPPFLLLPLVENAFKHGVNSQLEQSCLKAELAITNQFLTLHVENNFSPEYRKKNQGGLGLVNLRERLDYYYDSKYLLQILERDNHYSATLKLPLECQK